MLFFKSHFESIAFFTFCLLKILLQVRLDLFFNFVTFMKIDFSLTQFYQRESELIQVHALLKTTRHIRIRLIKLNT